MGASRLHVLLALIPSDSHVLWHPSSEFFISSRFTWACLTQHLAPMGFLNPSMPYSADA